MAHRLLRDPDADGWERADFPIVCGEYQNDLHFAEQKGL